MKVGEVVSGRYELEELVGVGGMSSVFRARDAVLERSVALKVLHEQFSSDPEYVERFRREARAIARLAHPNIVTVIDRGEYEGRQYIVFEHVDGETLKELVEREGPLPVEQALRIAHQVARGIAFAHEHGVVHRDVKPQNVLLNEDGVAKVTDFGIARSLEREEGLTETGTVLGTSDYLAPEQAAGQPVDERSDQYALGVLLYELLTGDVPYHGGTLVEVAMKHLYEPVPSATGYRHDISQRVDALIGRAMAKRPEDRFPTTDALVAALHACLAEEAAGRATGDGATQVLRVGAPAGEAIARPVSRRRGRGRPVAAVLAIALVAAGLVAAVIALADRSRQEDRPDAPTGQARVRLVAVQDYDPYAGDGEHPEAVARATDGDPATYWTTETYDDFGKPGVGIILDARRAVELTRVSLVSDEGGFTAKIMASNSPNGRFRDVSEEVEVGARATFALETDGEEYRYYLVWITELDGRAHVNEVRAG